MNRLIAERLVRTRMKERLEESRIPYRKVRDYLMHQLGDGETGISVDDIKIIEETPDSMTLEVEYEVYVQIPIVDPEDKSTYYEEESEFRKRTITFDKD